MIIYREQRRRLSRAEALAAIRAARDVRDLLIGFGELECGVADAVSADHVVVGRMRRIALRIGRALYRWSRGLPFEAGGIDREISALACAGLPETVEVSVPEGYAYYGLFPETYIDAAVKFFHDVQPRRAVCVGIRSIGTSLSAAVAGTLAELGVEVESWTVRPGGHPLDRVTELPTAFRASAAPHLIVDEGPGLSGSSFGSVAEALAAAGVPEDQIVLFPSWNPPAEVLVSERGRACWRRHGAYPGCFDARIVREDLAAWTDISAGEWRHIVFADESEFPAAHPQHERRKFLYRGVLAKFAGFGSRGRSCLERARALYDAGFVPRPFELTNGFLFSSFEPGRPVAKMSRDLMRRIAAYLAHVRRKYPLSRGTSPRSCIQSLVQMTAINVSEGLEETWTPPAELVKPLEDMEPCLLDARMLPHEWIETADGFLKSDAVDHADDHFFPGPQDIAWDLASVGIEFALDDPGVLLDEYERRSGDRGARRRLPFHMLAYAAFRLGYAKLAASSLRGAERERFRKAAARYSAAISRYSRPPVAVPFI